MASRKCFPECLVGGLSPNKLVLLVLVVLLDHVVLEALGDLLELLLVHAALLARRVLLLLLAQLERLEDLCERPRIRTRFRKRIKVYSNFT